MQQTIDLLTLNLLTTTIVAPPSNASKWQRGFNSAFKGLNLTSMCHFFHIISFPINYMSVEILFKK